jgi:hypothetical protein
VNVPSALRLSHRVDVDIKWKVVLLLGPRIVWIWTMLTDVDDVSDIHAASILDSK